MDLTAGDTVRDRYRLTEHLGTGGFATVWRADDSERESEVALKLPSFDSHDRETVLERFARERRLLEPFASGLSHATVVRYLDSGFEAEPRYIALEYLAGDPLSAAFRSGIGTGVRRRLAVDLAETLDFLHRNGVSYLDLKPENVVVRRSGRPVLLDFNTAVAHEEDVETRFGVDPYKPPELLAGDGGAVGPWSDVFSWGKLVFYLLTGANVETADVPAGGLDPTAFGSACSRALAGVVGQATSPAVSARYTDGRALAAAVARATERGPRLVLAHPSGVTCAVADGDTLGRFAPDEPEPWVALADPDGHVAPRHATVRETPEGWELVDESHNGTYVGDASGWSLALSEQGYRTQRAQGAIGSDRPRPPTAVSLPDGGVVAPVHPEYGIRLRVSTDGV